MDGAKIEEDPNAIAPLRKRRERTRNGAQVVAARVGLVGLKPAVGDADDGQVFLSAGMQLAQRQEGFVR